MTNQEQYTRNRKKLFDIIFSQHKPFTANELIKKFEDKYKIPLIIDELETVREYLDSLAETRMLNCGDGRRYSLNIKNYYL